MIEGINYEEIEIAGLGRCLVPTKNPLSGIKIGSILEYSPLKSRYIVAGHATKFFAVCTYNGEGDPALGSLAYTRDYTSLALLVNDFYYIGGNNWKVLSI
jgi:hypothetical protein